MTDVTNSMAECVVACANRLGEGIVWDSRSAALYWVDIPMPSAIHRFDPVTGAHKSWLMPEMVSALTPCSDGTFLVAAHTGLKRFDPANGELIAIAAYPGADPRCRSNDSGCDPLGRFWISTMMNNFAPDGSDVAVSESIGTLYRVNHDLDITAVIEGIGIPNALCFADDGSGMYLADTLEGTIFVYDLDPASGAVGDARSFAGQGPPGHPDGACVDAEGYVWNARWGGDCVVRFAPDGSVDRIVMVPANLVTSCAFGGTRLDRLYITTARSGLTPEQLAAQPLAGGLFVCEPGVCGAVRPGFAG